MHEILPCKHKHHSVLLYTGHDMIQLCVQPYSCSDTTRCDGLQHKSHHLTCCCYMLLQRLSCTNNEPHSTASRVVCRTLQRALALVCALWYSELVDT